MNWETLATKGLCCNPTDENAEEKIKLAMRVIWGIMSWCFNEDFAVLRSIRAEYKDFEWVYKGDHCEPFASFRIPRHQVQSWDPVNARFIWRVGRGYLSAIPKNGQKDHVFTCHLPEEVIHDHGLTEGFTHFYMKKDDDEAPDELHTLFLSLYQ